MWWNRMILGFDSYHVILWFLLYSILGWIVESIYMSICNRKLTNRGFAKGPFCPIYGVGALTVYFVLRPYSSNGFLLFLLGSLLATALELLTGIIMKRIFGEIWWDYHEKPFNYKGILCLESSIAWGFYTLFLFLFLQRFVEGVVAPPSPLHRELVAVLTTSLQNYIAKKHGNCKVYPAPFAVFIKEDDSNYVEPDISLVCDHNKISNRGCEGAPFPQHNSSVDS